MLAKFFREEVGAESKFSFSDWIETLPIEIQAKEKTIIPRKE